MNIEKIEKGIESYNKYRKNLVRATLIDSDRDGFKVRFEGNFCQYCGMDEYLHDLVYELERLGLEAKLTGYETSENDVFIAEYKMI